MPIASRDAKLADQKMWVMLRQQRRIYNNASAARDLTARDAFALEPVMNFAGSHRDYAEGV